MKLARVDKETNIYIYQDINKYYFTEYDKEKFYLCEDALRKAKQVTGIK